MTAGDTLYMIAADGKIQWRYSPEVPLTAQPVFRPDRNEIAIVGLDITFQRIDADTGKLLWQQTRMQGRASLGQVKAYSMGYLVLVSGIAYRDANSSNTPDLIAYWDEHGESVWSVEFPIGAELVVAGTRIYAMTYRDRAVEMQEITHPLP